jgi:hypothetical protein
VRVKTLLVFAAGALVGALITAALVRPTAPEPPPTDAYWRERAETAERDLAAARRQLETVAARLQELAGRFDALSGRFDKLIATPVVAATPPATAEAAARAEPPPMAEFQHVPDEQWDALVRGALESEIERRLGGTLPPERVQRLMDTLARVRDASRSLAAQEDADPADPRREVTRTVIVLQADQAFREELGIGVAEFLRGLDPEQVEDVGPSDVGGN